MIPTMTVALLVECVVVFFVKCLPTIVIAQGIARIVSLTGAVASKFMEKAIKYSLFIFINFVILALKFLL